MKEGSYTDQLAKLRVGESWSKVEQIDAVSDAEAAQRRLSKLASVMVNRTMKATGQEYVTDTGFAVMNSKCIYATVVVSRTR